MPRTTRNRRLVNPQRSQLVFVEAPRSGSRHHYGPQLRSAVNPRSCASERSRHSVPGHSWVSPQFTSLEETTVRRTGQSRGRKKMNNQLPTSTVNQTSLSTQVRRSTACKYPSLIFDTNSSAPLRCRRGDSKRSATTRVRDSPEIRPPESHVNRATTELVIRDQTPGPTSVRTSLCIAVTSGAEVTPGHSSTVAAPISTPEPTLVLTPPHIETPEMPRSDHASSSSALSLLFSPNQPRTPPRSENLLVRDTPESDYGLKVTWRRRKKLMRLLTERGLLNSDAMISNQ